MFAQLFALKGIRMNRDEAKQMLIVSILVSRLNDNDITGTMVEEAIVQIEEVTDGETDEQVLARAARIK